MTPTARRSPPLDHGHDLRQRGEASEHRLGLGRGADDREPLARVAPAAHVARRLAAERGRDRADQLAGAVEQQPLPSVAARSSRASASSSRASVLAPIPGTSRSRPAAAASRNSSAVRTPSERASSTERLALEAEVAPEADEVGRELALELGELGDLAGLDELAQPRLDPLADPAQLADPVSAHELGDRERGAADRLGGAAVGADRVRVRLDELEHQRERLEAVGDLERCPRAVVSRP